MPVSVPLDASAGRQVDIPQSIMIEPENPVTLRVRCSLRPALLLESDEGKPLPPSSVILRYRHLRQQQRTIQSGIAPGEGSGPRATRGIIVANAGSQDPVPALDPPSAPPHVAASAAAPPALSADDVSHAVGSAASPMSAASQGQTSADAGQVSQSSRSTRQQRAHLRLDESARDLCQSVMTSIGPLEITYSWRSLRTRGEKTRGEKTTWFASKATQLLDVPPKLSLVKPGDLYVHTNDDGVIQAWLRTAQNWTSVDLLHPHPHLRGYVLNFLKNGEPSWVTKDTVRTYKGRIEKRARDAKKMPGSAGSMLPTS